MLEKFGKNYIDPQKVVAIVTSDKGGNVAVAGASAYITLGPTELQQLLDRISQLAKAAESPQA